MAATDSKLAFPAPRLSDDQGNGLLTADSNEMQAPIAGKSNGEAFTSTPSIVATGYDASVFGTSQSVGATGVSATYLSIDFPGSNVSNLFGINQLGEVVGSYKDSAGSTHGFLYDGSNYTTIDPPNSTFSLPENINTAGEIVGLYTVSGGATHGFLYDGSSYTILDPPGSTFTLAADINAVGEVVGFYKDAAGLMHGFLYNGSSYTTIDPPGSVSTSATDINASGEVAGSYKDTAGATHGFLYDGSGYTTLDPPGSDSHDPGGITASLNDTGDVAGYYFSHSAQHAYLYKDGSYSTLIPPLSSSTSSSGAFAINNNGEVAGYYVGSDFRTHGFVYDGSSYVTLDPPGSTSPSTTFVTTADINDKGLVVGNYGTSVGHTGVVESHGFMYAPPGAVVPCFCRGTKILTARDELAVEDLQIGDRVRTLSGATKPIVWIGMGRVLVGSANKLARPVIVRRGALADAVPKRDLYLTHGHALYLDGVLIPVENLINHRSILWDEAAQVVEYYHIELEDHDVLFADGAPAESYYDANNRALFQNTREGSAPGAAKPTFAPVLQRGAAVERIWAALFERACGSIARKTTDEPDLHLRIDGVRLEPTETYADRCIFVANRSAIGSLRLCSRSGVPSLLGLGRGDHRRLGVPIERIVLCHRGIETCFDHDMPQLVEGGCYPPEDGVAWTDGEFELPRRFCSGLHGPLALIVHIRPNRMRYPLSVAELAAA